MMPPDAGGTSLTKHRAVMAWSPRELTDAVTCCTRYSRVSEPGTKINLHSFTIQATSQPNRVCGQMQMLHWKMLDPNAGSPATRKSVAGTTDIFVDDLVGTGGTEMEQHVLARLRKDFHIGSEDWNDVLFTGQRIRWMKDPPSGPSIEVSHERAIEELGEIPVEKNTKEDLHCAPTMHTRYRCLLGQINWVAE